MLWIVLDTRRQAFQGIYFHQTFLEKKSPEIFLVVEIPSRSMTYHFPTISRFSNHWMVPKTFWHLLQSKGSKKFFWYFEHLQCSCILEFDIWNLLIGREAMVAQWKIEMVTTKFISSIIHENMNFTRKSPKKSISLKI